MGHFFKLVGPRHAVAIFGVKLVGVDAITAKQALFTAILAIVVFTIAALTRRLARRLLRGRSERVRFWVRQSIGVVSAFVLVLGVLSIWFEDPTRLATGIGLVTAGLTFALQSVVTAFAGYLVILRGKTFNVGDRITMGGVRGDVIGLSFIQTRIMEMGQPPSVQSADPAVWVRSRQFTGRIVTVSNARIFDTPVYNYTQDFAYVWEEMTIPISFAADRARAEKILLEAAERHTARVSELSQHELASLKRRYLIHTADLKPRVYYRITDNWLELAVRFICPDHGIRDIKDAMSRDIIEALDDAGIGIASSTYDIVGLPPLEIRMPPTSAARDDDGTAHRKHEDAR